MLYKPMNYYKERIHPSEVLCIGKYKRYDFFILNMGTHPTAYVRVPKTHPFFGKFYDHCNPPHGFSGGPFTFADSSANFANFLDKPIPNGWYLGWDYAHLGDFIGCSNLEGRKYTTEEIIVDCKDVINYLLEVRNEPRERE